jgi:hypothetical protein
MDSASSQRLVFSGLPRGAGEWRQKHWRQTVGGEWDSTETRGEDASPQR